MSTTVSPYSSLPRTNFRGMTEEGVSQIVAAVASQPIRLPFFFTYAGWGDDTRAHLCSGSSIERFFGQDVINPLAKFYTHQSYFIGEQFRGAGQAILQRITPEDAKQASARFAIDVVQDQVPLYELNPDGSYRRDENDEKVPTGDTVLGIRIQHRKIEIPVIDGEDNFGKGNPSEGTMVSEATGDESTLTPWFDTQARWKGKRGDNEGLRFSAPTTQSRIAADADLAERLGAYVYRAQCVQRASAASTPGIQLTLGGAGQRDFTLVDDSVDLSTGLVYSAEPAILEAYESDDPTAFTRYGVLGGAHVYSENLLAVLTEMAELESDYTGVDIDPNQINFLTGVDVNGIPYKTIIVEGPASGGLLMNEQTNHFFVGGSDGTLGDAAFNAAVDGILDNLDNSEFPYHDIAALPYDSVWDSGFPYTIKRKFSAFHNLRPDVHVHACTQDVLQPTNTPEQDSSVAAQLRSHFRSTLESEEFGTGAVRYTVVGNAGIRIGDVYRKQTPFLAYLCYLGARYMGASDGKMKAEYSFGRGEENVLPAYRKHNANTKAWSAQQTDWDNGMNFAVFYDMNRSSWMGLRSIHENMATVLATYINVCIACNLTRVGHIVWRAWSGDSKLTDEQFLKRVNDKVLELTHERYDDRVVITPNAYRNALDEALKFSWHLDIGVSMDAGRTVQNLAIIARDRRSDEEVAQAA